MKDIKGAGYIYKGGGFVPHDGSYRPTITTLKPPTLFFFLNKSTF